MGVPNDDSSPLKLGKIKGVQGLPAFQHHVVGDIDDVVDGGNAHRPQTIFQPGWAGANSDSLNDACGVPPAELGTFDRDVRQVGHSLVGFGRLGVRHTHVTTVKDTDFASAVSELQKILDELGVAADSPARERLNEWQAEPTTWNPFATKTLGAEVEGVELFAQIKPAGDENRWFLICSFYANTGP